MRPRSSPLEIQKREFSRRWKGLDPVEVQTFLTDVAEDMEALARENVGLETRIRVARAGERRAPRARTHPQADAALGAAGLRGHPRASARKEGELIVREAQGSAERLTHNALQRSAEIEKAIAELKCSAPTSACSSRR